MPLDKRTKDNQPFRALTVLCRVNLRCRYYLWLFAGFRLNRTSNSVSAFPAPDRQRGLE